MKDDVDVAGVPTRFGADGEVRIADSDAEVVRRLRAAGAVIVGKTNTCELGQWPFTSGSAFGHTRNPWSREHTPGGSSGGSAAAVAAGLVSAAIGSDGAGSVRIPAAWTHLVKPLKLLGQQANSKQEVPSGAALNLLDDDKDYNQAYAPTMVRASLLMKSLCYNLHLSLKSLLKPQPQPQAQKAQKSGIQQLMSSFSGQPQEQESSRF